MKVEHRPVQVAVAQNHLEIPDEDTAKRVRGKPMAQTVGRQSLDRRPRMSINCGYETG